MNETSLLYLLIGLAAVFIVSAPVHTWLGKKLASAKAWEAREKVAVEDKWTSALALARALSTHVKDAIADVRADADRAVAAARAEAGDLVKWSAMQDLGISRAPDGSLVNAAVAKAAALNDELSKALNGARAEVAKAKAAMEAKQPAPVAPAAATEPDGPAAQA